MKITRIELVDDIDGKPATATVSFAVEGAAYEIDLSDTNQAKLARALKPFIDNARRVSGKKAAKPGRRARKGDRAAVRAWAKDAGYALADRGRIPEDVQAAYDAAHDLSRTG